jgi:tRNA(adenine34) deaminase
MQNYPEFSDEYFMNIALQEAKKAYENDEVPIGAIVVIDNKIIAKAYNQTEILQDATAHAEILAITGAEQTLASKYLINATLYVTIEPCIMCAGAMLWSKISRLVFGANEQKFGFLQYHKQLKINNLSFVHPKLKITSGILQEQAADLMKKFFQKKRIM